MKDLKFSVKDINDDHVKLGKKVQASFNQVPSTEIWSIDTVNSLLRHISFYRETNVFKTNDDISCLYEKLEELINHIEKQAELGLKFNYGELPGKNAALYRMYQNDLITGDNSVLAEIGSNKIAYINHNLINFMFTRNEEFTAHTFNTFQNAIQKSTQISLICEKARANFFAQLRKKIFAHKGSVNRY